VLCPGCPHRGIFYILNKLKLTVMGDIGCYTLSVLPPLQAMDTCLCMGAGVGQVLGFEKAAAENKGKAVAVIGDSTFVHSGITPLIDIVYNKGSSTVIILDNRTTAMTGRQPHPGTGMTLKGEKTTALDFKKLAKAIGVKSVRTVDPFDLDLVQKVISEEVGKDEPSLIISERPCVLIEKVTAAPLRIDLTACTGCLVCLKLGCPALSRQGKKVAIDSLLCNGCGLCVQVCKFDAIVDKEKTGGT
jgi:indolepyruvate ferredoxin oxidoreductase alpha subunit